MIPVSYIWTLIALPIVTPYRVLPTESSISKSQLDVVVSMRDYLVNITTVPYHVLVFYMDLFCSGSLVASRIVVTAASCFHKHTAGFMIHVKYGSDSMVNGGHLIKAKELKIHEYYERLSPLDNDIAIVFIEEHVEFSPKAMKLVLYEPGAALLDRSWVRISGWGFGNVPSQVENRLIWTEMQVMKDVECHHVYRNLKTPSNFCVKYQVERHLSDNGGPAVYNDLLVGILSYGANNDQQPFVALLTNVSYFHRWIVKNTKYFLEKYCVNKEIEFAAEIDEFGGDDH